MSLSQINSLSKKNLSSPNSLTQGQGLSLGGGGGAFTPAALSGLFAWYDAADAATITQVGGAVSQWNDKSTNAFHATNGVGAGQPLTGSLTVNGLNALLFDGSNDSFAIPAGFNAISGGNNTAFWVYKTDLTKTRGWIMGGISTVFWGASQNNAGAGTDLVASSGSGFPEIARIYDSGQHMMSMNRSGAVCTGTFDGTAVVGTGSTGLIANTTIGQLGGSDFYKGGICEIVVYNRSLTAAEQLQVETYLRTKWGTPQPIMAIGTQNRSNIGGDSIALNDSYIFRIPMQLGSDATTLIVNINNWLMAAGGEQATGNSFTITDMSVEAPNATVVPVKWATATTKAVTDGLNDLNSDELLPSQFGYSVFTRGDLYWIKGKLAVTAGQKIPFSDTVVGEVSGTQFYWYIAASTTPSATSAAGIYTFSGAAPTGRLAGFRPMLLGRPVTLGPSFIGTGDSILTSFTDSTDYSASGRAFFQRSMRNSANTGEYIPSINMSLAGIGYNNFAGGNVRWRVYIKYCKYGFDELGTNEVGDAGDITLVDLQNKAIAHWALLTAGGAQKVLRSKLLTKATSTDSWATTANQTAKAGWVAGSVPILFNAWLDTKVSDATLYAAASFDSAVLDSGDRTKWRVNGTPNYVAYDDTHPISNGHEFMAVVLRPILRTLT